MVIWQVQKTSSGAEICGWKRKFNISNVKLHSVYFKAVENVSLLREVLDCTGLISLYSRLEFQ